MKKIENKKAHEALSLKMSPLQNGSYDAAFSDGEKVKIDGAVADTEKLKAACKNIAGSEDPQVMLRLLNMFQTAIEGDTTCDRINDLANRVAFLEPKSPAEAMLCAQFASLQKAAMRCLTQINEAHDGNRIEFFINQCAKLTRLANETMSVLIRLRTAGQQVCTVFHVTNNGPAVVQQGVGGD